MKANYTLTAAKRLLPQATRIEVVREFPNCIQVTYWCNGGRCSTFLSKKAFKVAGNVTKITVNKQATVTEVLGEDFIVTEGIRRYIVRPSQLDRKERCGCYRSRDRAIECAHQIAVRQFVSQNFSLVA